MRRLLAIVLLSGLAACGGDSPAAPAAVSVVGSWNLRSIDGENLPYPFFELEDDKVEIISDVITATSSGAFTEVTTIRVTEDGVVSTETDSVTGSYVLSGSSVSFSADLIEPRTGSIDGNTLTFNVEGVLLVYRR